MIGRKSLMSRNDTPTQRTLCYRRPNRLAIIKLLSDKACGRTIHSLQKTDLHGSEVPMNTHEDRPDTFIRNFPMSSCSDRLACCSIRFAWRSQSLGCKDTDKGNAEDIN